MKMTREQCAGRMRCSMAVAGVVVLALAGTKANAALSIGVNFDTTRAGLDPVNLSAGVVSIPNWNNVAGTGALPTPLTTALAGSDGTTNVASLTLTSTAATGNWSSNIAADGGNGSLLDGYIDVGAGKSATAAVSGLSPTQGYDVYVYFQGDGARPGDDGAGLPNYTVNGTTIYTENGAPPAAFSGFAMGKYSATQSIGPGSVAADNAAGLTPGDYVLFSNVLPVGGSITISAGLDGTSFRSPLNGFELVPSAVPEPASVGLLGLGAAAALSRRRRAR